MRKDKLISGETYHLYNRGVNRNNIFFKEENWEYFLNRLRHYFTPQTCKLLAYCLMPNHYHLLLLVKIENFGRKVMHLFTIAYTKAVNKKQNRVGPLFQGPYQFRHIKSDRDLLHLSRYIHRNPIEAGFTKTPADWTYSSYLDYLGQRKDNLVNTDLILSLFENPRSFVQFVSEAGQDDRPQDLQID